MSRASSSTGPDPPGERAVDSPAELAADLLHQRLPTAEIERRLVADGIDAQAAAEIVDRLLQTQAAARKSAGKRNLFYGVAWCIGGAFVAVLTYQSAASGSTGGRYAVAGAAAAIGVLQFLWGLWKLAR